MTEPARPLAIFSLALLLLATGCPDEDDDDTTAGEPEWEEIEPAALQAGAADGTLDLPIGLPLTCYTDRCTLFGGSDGHDGRDSAYTVGFDPSQGIQTRVPIHTVWLQSGDRHAVLIKVDLGYSFDGWTTAMEQALGEATGVDLTDRVFTMTSHTHNSYGDYSQAHFLYLGHDRFNVEIFERLVEQVAAVAVEAHDALQPAAVGVGVGSDPDDLIFRSRRGEDEGLVDAYGTVVTDGYKDPAIHLIRVDASQGTADPTDDEPMAILFGWGMHGTIMGGDNAMVSTEASGHIELKLERAFEQPLTLMHFQTNGGDMSPAGVQSDFARMESVGERAAPVILDLWAATETTTEPVRLEALVRTVPMGRDITVTRDGTVDWSYPPYEEGYLPDGEVFAAPDVPISPFDEFIAPYGAGLCGDDSIEIPFVGMGVDVWPYNSCADVEKVSALFPITFRTDDFYELEMPLWETRSTMIGILGIEDLPVTRLGEGTTVEPVVLGFMPGEPCTLYGRAFQKGLEDLLGVTEAIPVGYAMDHEGYLMTVESWMRGGYEAQINIWGPLQGEYILEQMFELAGLLQTTVGEDPAWPDYADQDYPDVPRLPVAPDAAPGCGTAADHLYEYLWHYDGWTPPQPQPDPVVRRVSGIAHFLFWGGDPVIDLPVVTLQREQTPGQGDFADVLAPDGRPLTERGYEMVVSYTPDPLIELPDEVIDRHHNWLVEWQAVTDVPALSHVAGVPVGTYRFKAEGLCPDPGDDEYPYGGVPYELFSDPFEVTGEDALAVTVASQAGTALILSVAYHASPRGFRLLHLDSDYRSPTPLVGGDDAPLATVELLPASGQGAPLQTWADLPAPASGDASEVAVDLAGHPAGDYRIRVSDTFGNTGTAAVTLP